MTPWNEKLSGLQSSSVRDEPQTLGAPAGPPEAQGQEGCSAHISDKMLKLSWSTGFRTQSTRNQ